MSEQRISYGSNSGKVLGSMTMLLAGFVAVLALVDGQVYEVVCVAVFVGTLAWAAMVRPALSIVGTTLVLRNMLETVRVPLAAIESVTVRQVLVVRAGERKITSSAIGRSRRQIARDARPAALGGGVFGSMLNSVTHGSAVSETPRSSFGLMVEEQLRVQMSNARAAAGVTPRSPEQAALAEGIEKQPAVVEIALLALSVLVFVVLLVVG